jgi:hypothetical protein
MCDLQQKFPKLSKYMSIQRNINYADQIYNRDSDKLKQSNTKQKQFVNVINLPQNLAITNESWYEDSTSNFIYYPYKHKFGAPNEDWKDNFGGFQN